MTEEATIQRWRGIYPAICTPFAEDGGIDLEAQRKVVRFALDAGAHGIVAFGLAGEVLKLSAEEREALADVILEEVAGRVPVFIGVGAESLPASKRLARYAERAGASCLVVAPPVTARPGEEDLVSYFAEVAEEVSSPVMIQDAPEHLGVALGPALVAAVAERCSNVQLVKLEAGPAEMGRWLAHLGDRLSVWGGDGGVYELDCLRIGAAGIIPGVDLVDLLVEIYEGERRGDSETAETLFRRVLPMLVFEMQSIDHYNACAKHVLYRRGVLEHTALRPPARSFGDHSRRILDQHLDALDLDGVRAGSAL